MCSVWVFCSLVTVTNCDLSSSYSCIRVGTGKSIHVLTNGFWDGRGMGLCFLLPCSCVLNVENPPFMITNVGIMFQKPKTPWSSRKPMGFLWVFNGFSTSLSNASPVVSGLLPRCWRWLGHLLSPHRASPGVHISAGNVWENLSEKPYRNLRNLYIILWTSI